MAKTITLRNIYLAWQIGARLTTLDCEDLFAAAGLKLSRNRVKEFERDSDRGSMITLEELHAVLTAWAKRERQR